MSEVRYYMKGRKIRNNIGQVIAIIKRAGLFSKRFDLLTPDGDYILSIFGYKEGFFISETTDETDAYFFATRDKSFQIGLGPRFLSKPLIPLVDIPYGAYTGIFESENEYENVSVVIKKNGLYTRELYIDDRIITKFRVLKGGIADVISTFTYKLNYMIVSDNWDFPEIYLFIGIYTYFYYIKEKML